MTRIFISYSRKDEEFARRLATDLSQFDVDIWIDVDDIPPGMNWSSAIQEGLKSCETMVLIVSPDSMASTNVENEWQYFLDQGRTVIPVLWRPTKEINYQLSRVQYINFHAQLYDQALQRLLDAIKTGAGNLIPPASPKTAAAPDRATKGFQLWTPNIAAIIAVMFIIIIAAYVALKGYNDGNSVGGEKRTVTHAPMPTSMPGSIPTLSLPQAEQTGILEQPTLTPTEISASNPTPEPLEATQIPVIQEFSDVEMVLVPKGCFVMGSDPDHDPAAQGDEQPAYEVCFTTDFWIDQYEVTNEAYQQFIDAGGYSKQEFWSDAGWDWLQTNEIKGPRDYEGFTDPKQPRVGVSWYEADAYSRWRGGRLPTETEWEYAARGRNPRLYPWGDEYFPGCANFNATSLGGSFLNTTANVDRFGDGASWIGAYNMAGNALEWVLNTSDRYREGATTYEPETVTVETNTTAKRGVRGGSWEDDIDRVRISFRFFASPGNRSNTYGFRVLKLN